MIGFRKRARFYRYQWLFGLRKPVVSGLVAQKLDWELAPKRRSICSQGVEFQLFDSAVNFSIGWILLTIRKEEASLRRNIKCQVAAICLACDLEIGKAGAYRVIRVIQLN